MTVPNSMLNIMPWSCRYCWQGYYALRHISEEALLNNINLIELEGPEANKGPVWDTLISMNPMFVNGFGHGNTDIYTGDSETAIFTSAECGVLANRIVYLLSCLTGVGLGPAIINAGGIAYGGYNIAWTWVTEDLSADPYDLYLAEAFYRSSNEFPIALVQGVSVGLAQERCLAEYNRWIEIWETERGGDPSSSSILKWLIHDRNGLTVLGDQLATIVAAGSPTSLVVDVEPPQNVYPGDSFQFQGRLLDRETSSPISGKEVRLCQLGTEEPLAVTLTDSGGNWAFDVLLPGGDYVIYAFFPGDEDSGPSYSSTFGVDVGLTLMEVITPPKSSVEVDETVIFSGILIDKSTMLGLPGRTIRLIGAVSQTTITDGNGVWSFSFSFPVEGRHGLYAEFPGDSLFAGSATDSYRISIGLLPIIGYDGDEADTLKGAMNIIGTTFRTEESGIARSMVALVSYVRYSGDARMRCAIYRRSDMSLVGVTEERTFLSANPSFREWVTFIMVGEPRLEADTEYVLVGWASNSCSLLYHMTGDHTQGIEPFLRQVYNGFPDPYTSIWAWMDKHHSIFCEFIPDGAPPLTRILTIETIGQGTTDPAPGPWEYPEGSQVQVSAIPAAGWKFDYWEGDVSGVANPIPITVTQDMLIRAVFTEIIVPPEEHSVSISVIGQGTTNPPVGSYIVPDGESRTLTASPAAGWEFNRWQGSISSTESEVTVQVFADMSIVAVFTEIIIPTHIVTIGVAGQGTTDPAPGPWEYDEGDQVSIKAIPAAGWEFARWEGAISSTVNPIDLLITGDTLIRAVFIEETEPPPPKPRWIFPALLVGVIAAVVVSRGKGNK